MNPEDDKLRPIIRAATRYVSVWYAGDELDPEVLPAARTVLLEAIEAFKLDSGVSVIVGKAYAAMLEAKADVCDASLNQDPVATMAAIDALRELESRES